MKITRTINYTSRESFVGAEEHRIYINVNESTAWVDSMRTALLWLATTAPKTELFVSKADAIEFGRILAEGTPGSTTDAINLFRRQLDKDGDQWRILKTITASPKPIGTEPPDSVCPRCGMQTWAGRTRTERAENFKRNPYPLYCLTCGQRFKYEADGALAYTANVDTEKWTKRLTKENASQPDLTAVA